MMKNAPLLSASLRKYCYFISNMPSNIKSMVIVEMIEDLIVAATNEAIAKAEALEKELGY